MITEATPRHKDRKPSVVDIERICWVIVVRGGGDGRGFGIRVEEEEATGCSTGSEGSICIRV